MNTNFEDYEAQLVKVVDASFADAGDTFENGFVYAISDNSKATSNFRTTFYDVNYIGTTIPAGSGSIIGLLNSRDDGDYITSRFLDDLEWTLGEPTNYPDDFAATVYGQSVELTWTDADGDILPTGYLILASDNPTIALPEDGIPVPNDPDLSDGTAAMNISFGTEQYTFADLPADETYYFNIFPYTGSGGAIDYKTDGTPPEASATTYLMVNVLYTTFDESWENWTRFNVTGEQDWDRDNTYGIDGTACARISGYANQMANENENWLISPAIDLSDYESELLTFYSAFGFTGPALELKVTTAYTPGEDPNNFTWTDLSDQVSWPSGDPYFEWTHSGYIDVSAFGAANLYVAFIYHSTDEEAATWEVDNILVSAEQTVGINTAIINDHVEIYPNPGNGHFNINAEHDFDQLKVYSVSGQLVHTQDISSRSFALMLNHLENGLYLVHFYDNSTGISMVQRIVLN
jgi:hypothetical protein